jgi:hypothetical protein
MSVQFEHMGEDDLRAQIVRLEDEIEEAGKTIERCGKIGLVSKAAIAIGAILIVAILLGVTPFDPIAMIGALAAVIGGTVVFGSNASTLAQTTAALRAAEATRADLIGRIGLRVVGNGAWKGTLPGPAIH